MLMGVLRTHHGTLSKQEAHRLQKGLEVYILGKVTLPHPMGLEFEKGAQSKHVLFGFVV